MYPRNHTSEVTMAIKKESNGLWSIDKTIKGKRLREKGFKRKADAELFIAKRKSELDTDVYVQEKLNNYRTMTYSKIVDTYLEKHLLKGKSAKNAWIAESTKKVFGEIIIGKLRPVEIKEYLISLYDRYEPSTVKKHLTYINASINYAVQYEIIPQNPLHGLKFGSILRKENVRNVVIDQDDFERMKKLFAKKQWYVQGILLMLWHTGMRIGEILNLQWKKVDLHAGIITLNPDDVKENDVRTIGLEPEIVSFLKPIYAANRKKGAQSKDFVFGVTKDLPITYETIYKHWKNALKNTEFSHMNIHDLRHCYVTRKRREGHSTEIIRVQVGHKTDSMFRRYNSVSSDEVIAMSGFDSEKAKIIEQDVIDLLKKCHKHNVKLSTLHTAIRELRKSSTLE